MMNYSENKSYNSTVNTIIHCSTQQTLQTAQRQSIIHVTEI